MATLVEQGNLPGAKPGRYVVAQTNASFEKKASATETVTLQLAAPTATGASSATSSSSRAQSTQNSVAPVAVEERCLSASSATW
jgi:hypothetical protein